MRLTHVLLWGWLTVMLVMADDVIPPDELKWCRALVAIGDLRYRFILAAWVRGPVIPLVGYEAGFAMSSPPNACTPLTNVNEVKGKIVLVWRGACRFDQKTKLVQDAGGVAIIIANNRGRRIGMEGSADGLHIPALSISTPAGKALQPYAKTGDERASLVCQTDTPTLSQTTSHTTTWVNYTFTPIPTMTPIPTHTPTNTRTRTLTPLPTHTATRTLTPIPTHTGTRTPTPTPQPTTTAIPTHTATTLPTDTATPTATVCERPYHTCVAYCCAPDFECKLPFFGETKICLPMSVDTTKRGGPLAAKILPLKPDGYWDLTKPLPTDAEDGHMGVPTQGSLTAPGNMTTWWRFQTPPVAKRPLGSQSHSIVLRTHIPTSKGGWTRSFTFGDRKWIMRVGHHVRGERWLWWWDDPSWSKWTRWDDRCCKGPEDNNPVCCFRWTMFGAWRDDMFAHPVLHRTNHARVIVSTWDEDEKVYRVYFDGHLAAAVEYKRGLDVAGNQVWIGARGYRNEMEYRTVNTDMAYFDRVLSPDEVASIAAIAVDPSEPPVEIIKQPNGNALGNATVAEISHDGTIAKIAVFSTLALVGIIGGGVACVVLSAGGYLGYRRYYTPVDVDEPDVEMHAGDR